MSTTGDPEHGVPPSDIKEYEGYKIGDRVEYHPTGSSVTSTGIIRSIVTHNAEAGSSPHVVKADKEHPRFIMENDRTHKTAGYKFEAIVGKVEGEE